MDKKSLFVAVIIVIFSYISSCKKKSLDDKNIVSSKIKIDSVNISSSKKYRTGIIIKVILKNNSTEDIYFFEPFLKTVTKSGENVSGVLLHNKYDALIVNNSPVKLRKNQLFEGTTLGNELVNYIVEHHLILMKDSITQLNVKNMIFLKKGDSITINDEFYPLTNQDLRDRNESIKIMSYNITLKNDPKVYSHYKNLPEKYKGYTLWRGEIQKDSLDAVFPKNLGFEILKILKM